MTSDRVSYPDDPLGETWNYEQGTQLKSLDALGDYYGRVRSAERGRRELSVVV